MKRVLWTVGLASAAALVASCSLPGLPINLGVPLDLPRPTVSEVLDTAAKTGEAVDRWSAEVKAATKDLRQRCDELREQEVPLGEEMTLGGAVALNWMQTGGGLLHDDFDVTREPRAGDLSKPHNALDVYVATVGKNLAMQSPRPLVEWSFGVLDSENFNAFSAPGGYVMVTRGLLRQVTNEAQLAGVLAHEISHITQKHALSSYRELRLAECNKALANAERAAGAKAVLKDIEKAVGPEGQSFLHTLGANGFNLDDVANLPLLVSLTDGLVDSMRSRGFDENQELEADKLAVELMARAGYNPEEYIAFLGKIPKGAGANLTHHPPSAARQDALRDLVKELAEDPLLAANDKPFSDYAVVPLTDELAAAR